jgi:hypothetical protein
MVDECFIFELLTETSENEQTRPVRKSAAVEEEDAAVAGKNDAAVTLNRGL